MLQSENFDSDEDNMFIRWRERNNNSIKKKTRFSPIELLLLGRLRYLGRGWTFLDDLEESTFIARDVHREFGAKYLYPKFVFAPFTLQELRECEYEYRKAGFPGCLGSTADETHITLEKVRFR